jgi:hypothetical protein
MQMKRAILSAALAVALVAGVSAQDKPNFAGTWKIDPARSDKFSGGAPPETITVEGSKMTVSRTRAGNTDSNVYMLDGTPSKNMVGPAGKQIEMIYTSRWEGNALVTIIPGPAVNRIEKRSFEPDGTMKVELTFDFVKEDRSESSIRVFIRVE